jgi:hypothetical protein
MRNNLSSPIFIAAFSLLEISIVLIIVGLIAGGIIGGQSLMKNSKIRNIAVRAQEYVASIDNFKQKYNALPGDMPNATQMWGRADGGTPLSNNCAAPATDVSATLLATCNGDGDHTIGRVAAQNYETFRVWQHLQAAGYIAGSFTGVAGAAGAAQALVGVNVPKGEIAQTGYDLAYIDDAAVPATYFTGQSYRHVLHYALSVAGNNAARGAAISAADAYGVDLKVDDGKPGSGKLMSFTNTAHPTCASTDVSATAVYQLTNATVNNCTLVFVMGF